MLIFGALIEYIYKVVMPSNTTRQLFRYKIIYIMQRLKKVYQGLLHRIILKHENDIDCLFHEVILTRNIYRLKYFTQTAFRLRSSELVSHIHWRSLMKTMEMKKQAFLFELVKDTDDQKLC